MQIDWWTLGLQTLNAVVLIWLLAHFLFRPVANAIAARQKAADQLIADARAAKTAAENERNEATAEASRLTEHRAEALKAAAGDAAAEKLTLIAAARTETDKLRAAAAAEIEAARRNEALINEDRAVRLAIDIAGKLLDRLPREARVAAFIDGIVKGLSELPEGTRASLGAAGVPIRLAAARAVTAQEIDTCRKAFTEALGHPVALDVSIEPALIAGLELEASHAVVRNSFRADLLRLKSELMHHDASAA